MKKITLIFSALLASVAMQAQNDLAANPEGSFLFSTFSSEEACSQGDLSEFNLASSTLVAFDVSVGDGEAFELSKLTFQYLTTDDSTIEGGVTIVVYSNTGDDMPDQQLHSENYEIATSEIVGVFDTGTVQFNINQVELNIDDIIFDETSWVSIVAISSTGASPFLIMNTDSVIGMSLRGVNSDTGEWEIYMFEGSEAEALYLLEGECVPLSTNDYLLSQVAVYPNPASDVINISLPASVEVVSTTLFDILGKNTGVSLNNGAINISSLARGVYMLNIETNQGSITKKIMKR